MNQDQLKELKRMIIATGIYYQRDLPDEVLQMYVGDLQDLDFSEVITAMTSYRRDPKNTRMFLPAQIREIIMPTVNTKDLARETALRIQEAVTKFGWPNPTKAQEFIGEAGWAVVERFGGWSYLCQNLGVGIQPGQFIAQCRDAIESHLNLERAGINKLLPAIEQTIPTRIGNILRLASKKSLPGGNE